MPETTPTFRKPPVVEVVVGLQFREPIPLQVIQYGKLWDTYGDRYPEYTERPALSPALEDFGLNDESRPHPRGPEALFPRAPFRLWFASPDDGGLIQVQSDRFVFNWRQEACTGEYPRFHNILNRFRNEYQAFLNLLSEMPQQEPEVELCEVTYINHILSGSGWNEHSEIDRVFPSIRMPELELPNSEPEAAEVKAVYLVRGLQGNPGRIHLGISPVVRAEDARHMFAATLIARSVPAYPNTDTAIATLDEAHRWVATAFRDITSTEMHEHWELEGRQD